MFKRGYNCGHQPDASEDAHWPKFWKATVEYIHETYPQPWNAKAKGLIAFFFGLISHGVADVTWHSLGLDQGFIQAMSHANYNGDYRQAHSDADTGGEFVLARYAELDYDLPFW